jgi:hypothetical protein
MSKKKPNQKNERIKAVVNTLNGIEFKSKLESYCYSKLKENKIKVKYEGKTFILIKKFKFKGKTVRPITYTPDFIGKNFIIECKGWIANESFPLRWKLFKLYLINKNLDYDLYLPSNRKEVDEVIEQIKLKLDVPTRRTKGKIQRIKDIISILF